MRYETLIAVRFLRRRARSRFLSFMTVVAFLGVALGTAALAITFSILGGFERTIASNIIGISSHIQVATFRNELVRDDSARTAALRAVPNVRRADPFLQREAIVVMRGAIDGVLVKGLPADADQRELRRRIVAGSGDLRDEPGPGGGPGLRPVIVGRRFAERAGLRLGDRAVFIGVTSFEDAATAPRVQCVVRGMYETGMAEYFDDVQVFVSLETAQAMFAAPGAINGYDVRCGDVAAVDATVADIETAIGYPFNPRSVFTIYRNLFVWVDLQKQLIPIVVGSLIIIAVFNIVSTLLLLVIEKTSAIGILLALGASRAGIRRIFVRHGVLVSGLGAAAGSAAAFALCLAQQRFAFFRLPQDIYYMTTVPIHLSVPVFLLPAAAAVALAFLSSFIPAWLAARLNPITSIRFR